jgi:hypothetical protein
MEGIYGPSHITVSRWKSGDIFIDSQVLAGF